ncbi:TetR family transcriptional regulator [Leifsonia sp. NPDC080035]|uniref:TetR family transcriptional regulator n=1 Tax=Leifsonia sp. NPDC080035 TaxID=3143936 RepID=A0AAU7GE13_9MICO
MTDQRNRRTRLRALDDAQAINTRARLVAAYSAAAAEGVRNVSVRWICASSGVARSTFYTHFSGVEDLAAFTVTEDFARLAIEDLDVRAAGMSGAAAARGGLAQVVATFTSRRALVDYSFAQTSRAVVVDRIIDWFAGYTRETVERAYAGADEARIDLVTGFISAGVIRTIIDWLDEPRGVTREGIVDALVDLLPEPLRTEAE